VILCGIRSIKRRIEHPQAELCVAYKEPRRRSPFDLAGAEYNFPARKPKKKNETQEAFQLILNNNVNCTAHAARPTAGVDRAAAIHYCGRTASATAPFSARTVICSTT